MMVSNELLDYLGEEYKKSNTFNTTFIKFVEIYVDNVEYLSKKVELKPFTIAFYKECKKH